MINKMNKKAFLFLTIWLMASCGHTKSIKSYPKDWWTPIDRATAASWEILPQDARPEEVILSKRTELGVFSNLGHAEFDYDGIHYASVEGLWQGMKYPEANDNTDPRNQFTGYPFTRTEVYKMHGFDSKKAGDKANHVNKTNGVKWVSYKGKRFNYKDGKEGSKYHYKLIKDAMKAKLKQNPKLKRLLKKTKGLRLKPDHRLKSSYPPSYHYYKIWEELRKTL
jgi:predicted NAD-dependent protein-ADP-ribosyltransferase YbiA (DUF1768 family)